MKFCFARNYYLLQMNRYCLIFVFISQGDIESATFNVERGLNVIGRPWSSSMMNVVPSLLWHSMCHVLHQLGLLSFIKSLGWIILPRRLSLADSKVRYHSSCTMAAKAYSTLLQLSIMGRFPIFHNDKT